jgi:hypothetical protein
VGRHRLKYLKQVERNMEADSHRATLDLQKFVMENCQPIRKLKDKTNKKKKRGGRSNSIKIK